MNEENMRRLVIFGDGESNTIDSLKMLSNWSLHDGKSENHQLYLKNGDTKIYLRTLPNGVTITVNILPQDHMNEHPSFKNDALQKLVIDLKEKNIDHTLEISDNDVKLLQVDANSFNT